MTDPETDSGARFPGETTRRTVLKTISVGAGLATIGGTVSSAASEDYWTVVALTDTQFYARDERFGREQTEWIVNNLEAENIVFVSHGGDIVNNADNDDEWAYMTDAMSLLDGQVPYGTVTGNHEYEEWFDRSSSIENYKQYFGPQNFTDRDWYGGAGPTNGDPNRDELNSYQLFSAGGYDFLHLALEWEAPGSVDDPDTPLGWAQSVLDDYPDRPTILTTHSYLRDDTEDWSTVVQEVDDDGNTGATVWESLVKPNPQVFMTLSGHWFNDDGEYRQVSMNDAGSPVYQMLANYQGRDLRGEGYLRRIEFHPGGGTDAPDRIQVRSYSPVLEEYYEDADSKFGFDLDFDERFDASGSDSGDDSEASADFRQGVDGYAGTVDTNLVEKDPETSFETASTITVDAKEPQDTQNRAQALVRFDDVFGSGETQVPPSSTITNATLSVETVDEGSGAAVHRMLTEWSAGETWDSAGDGIQPDGEQATVDPDTEVGPVGTGPTSIDVTGSVQAWADGETNAGWAFLPLGDDGWDFATADSESPPRLTVEYEPPDTSEGGSGDADGDGDVDGDDVDVVQEHIADKDVDIDTEAADVDGDGDVDIGDAVRIRTEAGGE
ncbi:DNRLRE domain-containing protein [Natronomonas amylolytica]|uniref:DNRLRE domain-containing protein n=1 Tax=Natronomonas amylolytica TaxID=3108498 RepID=UPI003009680A